MFTLFISCNSGSEEDAVESNDEQSKKIEEKSEEEITSDAKKEVEDGLNDIETIEEEAPINSTNTELPLGLSFNNGTETKMNLVLGEESPDGITINTGNTEESSKMVITYFKMAVSSIAFKSSKQMSPKEKKMRMALKNFKTNKESDQNSFKISSDRLKKDIGQQVIKVEKGTKFKIKLSPKEKKQKILMQMRLKELVKKEKELDPSIKFSGPYLLDLITNETTPALENNVMVKDGKYNRISLNISPYYDDETEPLFGHSVYIAGYSIDAQGTETPFSFPIDESFSLRLQGKKAIEIGKRKERSVAN